MNLPPSTSLRVWSFDEVQFDEGRLELEVAGLPVSVPRLALSVLQSLLRAAPHVVPRDELLATLWLRAADEVSRNVLSNAVARLRVAIGDVDARRIVAVRGTGYRMAGRIEHRAVEAEPTHPLQLPPRAQEFLMRHWFGALQGRKGFDPSLSVCDVLRRSIGPAERELADDPLALAALHQHLAEHDLAWSDHENAANHFRRALALLAQSGQAPTSEPVLGLRFELCRALTTGAALSGDSARLAQSRDELRSVHSALARNPQVGAATRLKATFADWALAGFELDWPRAQRAAEQATQLAAELPELPAPQWFALHRNRGVTLARAGDLAAGIRALEALLARPNPPLAADDVQVLVTRLNLGQFQWLDDRHADARATLQSLHDDLRGNAVATTHFGIDTDIWLAKTLISAERADEAFALLASAHARASASRGATSELALSALVPLTRLMGSAGDHEAALVLLEAGMRPRLNRLAMPGQREAVMALAHWLQMLWSAGQHERARSLARHLLAKDLEAAALRPADARAAQDCLRDVLHATGPASAPLVHNAGTTSISVC